MVGQLVEWLEQAIAGKLAAEAPPPSSKRSILATLNEVLPGLWNAPDIRIEISRAATEPRLEAHVWHRSTGFVCITSIDERLFEAAGHVDSALRLFGKQIDEAIRYVREQAKKAQCAK